MAARGLVCEPQTGHGGLRLGAGGVGPGQARLPGRGDPGTGSGSVVRYRPGCSTALPPRFSCPLARTGAVSPCISLVPARGAGIRGPVLLLALLAAHDCSRSRAGCRGTDAPRCWPGPRRRSGALLPEAATHRGHGFLDGRDRRAALRPLVGGQADQSVSQAASGGGRFWGRQHPADEPDPGPWTFVRRRSGRPALRARRDCVGLRR